MEVYVEVNFIDSSGFILDWDNATASIYPGDTKNILGQAIVKSEIAGKIFDAVADISSY
jgi:hypothetical protein